MACPLVSTHRSIRRSHKRSNTTPRRLATCPIHLLRVVSGWSKLSLAYLLVSVLHRRRSPQEPTRGPGINVTWESHHSSLEFISLYSLSSLSSLASVSSIHSHASSFPPSSLLLLPSYLACIHRLRHLLSSSSVPSMVSIHHRYFEASTRPDQDKRHSTPPLCTSRPGVLVSDPR